MSTNKSTPISHLFYNARSNFHTASETAFTQVDLFLDEPFPEKNCSRELVFNSQSEANAYWLVINCQCVTTTTHTCYKQTWQMHARNLPIALTVFQVIITGFMRKVVAQKKICNTKNPVRFSHLRKSENYEVRNRIHLRNGCEKEICPKDKASCGKQ